MSNHWIHARGTLATLFAFSLATIASGQQFTSAPGQIPQGNPSNNSSTENVDFADIDQDGDWDAAFADGGDVGSDQSRIWVNQGFLQGGALGFFNDVTAAQAPAVTRQSRDIEFVDFDNDSDVDIYISNTSSLSNQGGRWWTNMGNLQAGTTGFYQDQTATRWVGLGGPGSSVPPSAVLPGGGFIEWSCDSDFGDIDNDGDIDLIASSYGSAFGGQVPTRMFLNNGTGIFSEFNPSGFQLAGTNIANGNPGLWCSGVQQSNTTNTSGANCDIATNGLDLDIGDIDGDLDLDLLLGSRSDVPRMFKNRLEENNGVLTSWLDVSAAVFPPGYAIGNLHYANEFGDFDDDGDLDIYGLSWQNFFDVTLTNDGSGTYINLTTVPGSGADESECDFMDYENDGDLDVLVSNFSGQERMYTNTNALGSYALASGVLPTDSTTSLDADSADVDNDGDTDIFVANDAGTANEFLKNNLNPFVAETHAPRLYRLEQALDRVANATPTVVRVQVYDNVPYYTAWYYDTRLEVQVNAGPVTVYPMRSSMGQVFRGEIPGNLVGTITYRALSTDRNGNTGATSVLTYEGVNGTLVGTSFCSPGNDLATTQCPCLASDGQTAAAGHGCGNSVFNGGAQLSAVGTTSPDTVQFTASDIPATAGTIYLQGSVDLSTGTGALQFGDGIRCAGGSLLRLGLKNDTDADSVTTLGPASGDANISTLGSVTPGSSYVYQTYYRNPNPAWCVPNTFNVTQAIGITW